MTDLVTVNYYCDLNGHFLKMLFGQASASYADVLFMFFEGGGLGLLEWKRETAQPGY